MFRGLVYRRRAVVFAVLFAGVVATLLVARWRLYFHTPMLEHGDIAVNALQVENAKRFSEIYGNYSRFEFNHPGPAFFYMYALGDFVLHGILGVTPSPANAHLIACMTVQAGFFALGLALIGTHLRWRALPALALVAGAFHFAPLEVAFVSIWPPHVLLMPFFCLLAAAASVGSGRLEHTPILVLAGGFLFHGHVAQPLFVGTLGLVALALGVRRVRSLGRGSWREFLRSHRATLLICGPLTALFLLPIAIDVVCYGREGNVATIVARFAANTEDGNSAFKSLLYFLSFATRNNEQETLFDTLGPQTEAFFLQNAWRIAGWLAILAAPPIWLIKTRRQTSPERPFLLSSVAILTVGIGACVLWGMAQSGGMYQFNGHFYYSVYYFGLVLALSLVARRLEPFWHPAGTLAAAAVAAGVLGVSYPRGAITEQESGLGIQRGVQAALAGSDRAPKLLVFEHQHWPEAAAVALELRRQGIATYMAPWWTFMFQRRSDALKLGPQPETRADAWWIAAPDTGGVRITDQLHLHREPRAITSADRTIDFRSGGTGFRHVLLGITGTHEQHASTDLPEVSLQLRPERTEADIELVFDVAAAHPERKTVTADILLDGTPIGHVTAAERALHRLRVPAAVWNRSAVAKLELRFRETHQQRFSWRPGYTWWTAWDLWEIRAEPVTAAPDTDARTGR